MRRSELVGPLGLVLAEPDPGWLAAVLQRLRVVLRLVTVVAMSLARGANGFPTSCCFRDMVGVWLTLSGAPTRAVEAQPSFMSVTPVCLKLCVPKLSRG